MLLLVVGILIWSVVHWFPAALPGQRQALLDSMGNVYKGLYALVIFGSLALMVFGWRTVMPEALYQPAPAARHATMLLMLIAIGLFGLSHSKSRFKRLIRHPQLAAVACWSVAHLLANGEDRSVVLFGGLLIWSLVAIVFINRRDREWERPSWAGSVTSDIIWLVITIVIYAALVFSHPYFAGVPVVALS